MEHAELREMILVYEDLTDEEQRLVDHHLVDCPTCRHLLDSIHSAERVAVELATVPTLPAPDDPEVLSELNATERTEAAVSRRLLLTRVRAESRRRRNWWPAGLSGLAMAAVLTLAFFQPWNGDAPLVDLRLTTTAMVRGEASVESSPDAVTLRYVQQVDGWPVVVRLSEEHPPELLLPTPDWPSMKLMSCRPVVLPPAGGGHLWPVPSSGAQETYLLAISQDSAPSVAELQLLLETVDESRTVKKLLADRYGHVSEVHAD